MTKETDNPTQSVLPPNDSGFKIEHVSPEIIARMPQETETFIEKEYASTGWLPGCVRDLIFRLIFFS